MALLVPFLIGSQLLAGGLGAYGNARSGKIAKALGKMRYQSAQQHALQLMAAGQRASFEEKRQARLIASRAVAVAAAGGGNPDDMSISKIVQDINGEGAYRAAVAMYEAESQADQVLYEGRLAEFTGVQEGKAANLDAVGSLLSMSATMAKDKKMGVYG